MDPLLKSLMGVLLLGWLWIAVGRASPPGAAGDERPARCTYQVATWNTRAGRLQDPREVSHPYAATSPAETDPATGCTVCEEDQRWVKLEGLPAFRLCKKIAGEVETALRDLQARGEPILEARGYQVMRSRGPVDGQGNRTELSNHAFGTALDLNRAQNGLYDRCPRFGPGCRLVLGGAWRPGARGALTQKSPIVLKLKQLGLLWGGELKGRQKDFMHFSRSGD
jgi:hypothetical protein